VPQRRQAEATAAIFGDTLTRRAGLWPSGLDSSIAVADPVLLAKVRRVLVSLHRSSLCKSSAPSQPRMLRKKLLNGICTPAAAKAVERAKPRRDHFD
jgi:hypothetical protein